MKKYIAKNPAGDVGKKWHSNPRCKMIPPDSRAIFAPDSMLRAYGILEKCAVCHSLDTRVVEDDSDLRPVYPLLLKATYVITEQVERKYLRDELTKRDIPFTLRQNKATLCKKLCKCWFRERDYSIMLYHTQNALSHWNKRIAVNDRHDPVHYVNMKNRCMVLSDLLMEENKKWLELRNCISRLEYQ